MLRVISRIVLIPVVAGLAYELIRFLAARYARSRIVRIVMKPGLAAQRLTTREPDLSMCAVAIAALEPVIAAEEAVPAEVASATADLAVGAGPANRPLAAAALSLPTSTVARE